MKKEKYIYQYEKNGKPYVIAKFYGNRKLYQKVFVGQDAFQRAKSWKESELRRLKKQGRFRIGINKYGLPDGIFIQVTKERNGGKRRVLKITGGHLNGKHLNTSVPIYRRSFEEGLKIALAKRQQFKQRKREADEKEKTARQNSPS